jgi:predicted DsbA family dithiol-disulfide isomerase
MLPPALLADIAKKCDVDRAKFLKLFQSADIRNETFRDLLMAKDVEGVPCLVAGSPRHQRLPPHRLRDRGSGKVAGGGRGESLIRQLSTVSGWSDITSP